MSTLTKQAVQSVADLKAGYILGHADVAILNELARLALASLEAEPVAYVDPFAFQNFSVYRAGETDNKRMGREWMWANPDAGLIPVYTSPPEPVTINAEPVAWLWSHRKHPSEVSLVKPEDDERAEGAHWSGRSCQALYAAPQVPVSLPDDVSGPLAHAYKELTPTFMRNHIDVFERYGIYPDGSAGIQAMRIALDGMNRRATMLQGADGNSPVIQDGWVACVERMPETMVSVLVTGTWFHHAVAFWDGLSWCDLDFEPPVTHWMPLPAAPQQEVK